MKVIEAQESLRPMWDSFVAESPQSSLLQSWDWGRFKKSYGEDILRLAVTSSKLSDGQNFLEAQSKVLGAMFLVKRSLTQKMAYYYAPHGPILASGQIKEVLPLLLERVEKEARKNKIAFLRLEPKINLDQYLGITPEPDTIQAQYTLILDISPPAKEILKGMKPKHRYNIRLAKRRGVKVAKAETVQEIDRFWQLLEQGAEDNQFQVYPKDYYLKQFEVLSESNMEDLFLARKNKKIIAAILVGYFGRSAYYLHGAMAREYRSLMAPHRLQWEAILAAKERGCTEYNFWGVAPPKARSDHPWQGFTRFKRGFAPQTKPTIYPGTYYLPYNRLALTGFKMLKKAKKWLDL